MRKAPEALGLLELQQLDDRKEKIQAKDDEDDNVNKPGRGPINLQGTGLRQAYSNLYSPLSAEKGVRCGQSVWDMPVMAHTGGTWEQGWVYMDGTLVHVRIVWKAKRGAHHGLEEKTDDDAPGEQVRHESHVEGCCK